MIDESAIKAFNVHSFLNAEDELHQQAQAMSKHIKLKTHKWAFTLWKGDEVSIRPTHCIEDNEKLLMEWYNDLLNNTNKSPDPLKFEPNENVILLQGIKESIDRDFGLVSTKLDWASLGSSSTSEDEIQTDLIAEFTDTAYARQVFSTQGSQQRVNQTGKLGMLWDDTSFDATPRTIREAGIHWHLTNSASCHARVVSTDFILNAGDLFVSQISELQENGTL
jgi:hypothetical protein